MCEDYNIISVTFWTFPDLNVELLNLIAQTFFFAVLQILVLGGSGFVGTAVCKAALAQGISVVSLSR